MIDNIELSSVLDVYNIDFAKLLTSGLIIGLVVGFTVVFISLGIKYCLKLFAKS